MRDWSSKSAQMYLSSGSSLVVQSDFQCRTLGTSRGRRFRLMILNDAARDADRGDVRRDVFRYDCPRADDRPFANAFSVNDHGAGTEVDAVSELYTARNVATGIDVAISADDCIVSHCGVQIYDSVGPDLNLSGQDAAGSNDRARPKFDPPRHPRSRVNRGTEIETEGRGACCDRLSQTRISYSAYHFKILARVLFQPVKPAQHGNIA